MLVAIWRRRNFAVGELCPNRVLMLRFPWLPFGAVGIEEHFPDFGYLKEPHRFAAIAWAGIVTTVFEPFLMDIALEKASSNDAAILGESIWVFLASRTVQHRFVRWWSDRLGCMSEWLHVGNAPQTES